MSVRLLPSGERAVLVQLPDAASVHGYAAAVRALGDEHIEEIVPGARTVLVVARAAGMLAGLAATLERLAPVTQSEEAAAELLLEVDYDGEDLHAVATETGLSVEEVVRRHSAARYTVDFVGFAPGFGYLSGLDPVLHLPRLASPRPSVPAGSVAIAGPHSAVYPRSSPGGWRLLGRTDAVLFDAAASPPSRLQAGTVIRFVAR